MSLSFAICSFKVKSLDNQILKSCEAVDDFVAIEETCGYGDMSIKLNGKTYEYINVECKFIGIKSLKNHLNSFTLKLWKVFREKFTYEQRSKLTNGATGQAVMWRTKDGDSGLTKIEITYPLEIHLVNDIRKKILAGDSMDLMLTGKSYETENNFMDNYSKSIQFVFDTNRWTTKNYDI